MLFFWPRKTVQLARIEGRLAAIERQQHEILKSLTSITWKASHMINVLQALEAQVRRAATIEASLVTLVHGLADFIKANASDPTALETMADQLKEINDFSEAVLANTTVPAEPAKDPAPVVTGAGEAGNAPSSDTPPSSTSSSEAAGSSSTEPTTDAETTQVDGSAQPA